MENAGNILSLAPQDRQRREQADLAGRGGGTVFAPAGRKRDERDDPEQRQQRQSGAAAEKTGPPPIRGRSYCAGPDVAATEGVAAGTTPISASGSVTVFGCLGGTISSTGG